MIRVLLVDDHNLVREGLKQIISARSDMAVAAEAANGDEALSLVKAREFDVAVLDMSMPGLSGLDLIKRLKLERPKLRMLVLSMHGEKQYAARALKAGASGYLTKDSAPEQLVAAILKISAGGVHISETAAASLIAPAGELTDREFEVLRLLASGLGPTEIGEKLHLSVKTVSTHKANLQHKLGLDSTAELVRYAIEHKLV
jgi:DNA-binding NarL/FixJ family response regulator